MTTTSTPKSKLATLGTAELIVQYDLAISDYRGRGTNHSPRQQRIDYIVNLLSARADAGDSAALNWYEA